MPYDGQRNERFGLYKTACCGATIVINAGAIFPFCPKHRKLSTNWTPVADVRIEPATTHKLDACIEDYHLLDVVIGQFLVAEWEEHLHTCDVCQGVLYALLRDPFQDESDDPSIHSLAA